MTDYYRTLGVARNATQNEIKSAFRKLAQQYHPDVSEDPEESEARFVRILEAYEVLGDPEKRRPYDLSLATGTAAGLRDFKFDDFSRVDELEDLLAGELLDTLFGRRGRYGPRKGADLRFDVELSLEDAFHGATRQVLAPRAGKCAECGGTGTARGGTARPCRCAAGWGRSRPSGPAGPPSS